MQRFSIAQASLLLIGFVLGTAIILVPNVDSGVQDLWMSPLFAGIPGALVLSWMLWLLPRFPGKDLIQISQDILGKYLGSLLGLIWVIYFFIITVLVARNLADFANVFFVSTPDLVLIFILIAVVYGKLIVESLAVKNLIVSS